MIARCPEKGRSHMFRVCNCKQMLLMMIMADLDKA